MFKPAHVPTLSREELLALVAELQRQIGALRAEIDELKRGGKRQAAPLSKGSRVAEPKPPGRKPGMGTFRYREAPSPKDITAPPMDVKVTRDSPRHNYLYINAELTPHGSLIFRVVCENQDRASYRCPPGS
jgi:uncharacterized small protein (DUF1192 family)